MPEPSVPSPAIYQLRVVRHGVSPLVWRRLLVASDTSLADPHAILQRTFAWSDDHLHRFLTHGSAYGVPGPGGITFRDDARRHVAELRVPRHESEYARNLGALRGSREEIEKFDALYVILPTIFAHKGPHDQPAHAVHDKGNRTAARILVKNTQSLESMSNGRQ